MKKITSRKLIIFLIAVLCVIQFIQPNHNHSDINERHTLQSVVQVPETVESILAKSCYDCHSNQTHYPWYSMIQPIGWFLQKHVQDGMEELNFSEYATYTLKRQLHKLEEIAEMIEHDEMPLSSYTLIHTDTKLSPEQKQLLIDWSKAAFAELKGKNP